MNVELNWQATVHPSFVPHPHHRPLSILNSNFHERLFGIIVLGYVQPRVAASNLLVNHRCLGHLPT